VNRRRRRNYIDTGIGSLGVLVKSMRHKVFAITKFPTSPACLVVVEKDAIHSIIALHVE